MGGAKQRRGAERRARGCVVAATRAAYIHTYFRVGPSWLVPVGASLGRLFDSAPHCEYWETPPPSNHFRGSTQLVNPGYVLTRRRGADTHGTHTRTNGTAYIRGTYSRVHTQTHTNTNKHTTWPDKVRCGLTPWRRPPHQRREPRHHPQQAAYMCN